MKHLVFLLFSVFTYFAQGQCLTQAISGHLLINENGYFLVDTKTQVSSALIPSTVTAKNALEQLESMDFLSGSACLSLDSVLLSRVEFVGLHRLIGKWKSTIAVNVSFRDYNRVSFGRGTGRGNQFRYALVPNEGNQWRVFLSDDLSVMMGTISIDQKTAVMELFDPDTGNLEERFSLKKVH